MPAEVAAAVEEWARRPPIHLIARSSRPKSVIVCKEVSGVVDWEGFPF